MHILTINSILEKKKSGNGIYLYYNQNLILIYFIRIYEYNFIDGMTSIVLCSSTNFI